MPYVLKLLKGAFSTQLQRGYPFRNSPCKSKQVRAQMVNVAVGKIDGVGPLDLDQIGQGSRSCGHSPSTLDCFGSAKLLTRKTNESLPVLGGHDLDLVLVKTSTQWPRD